MSQNVKYESRWEVHSSQAVMAGSLRPGRAGRIGLRASWRDKPALRSYGNGPGCYAVFGNASHC